MAEAVFASALIHRGILLDEIIHINDIYGKSKSVVLRRTLGELKH